MQSHCESLLRLQLPFDYCCDHEPQVRKAFVDSDCICLLVVLGYWSSGRIFAEYRNPQIESGFLVSNHVIMNIIGAFQDS